MSGAAPIVLDLAPPAAAGEPGWRQPIAGGELWSAHPLAAGALPAPRPAVAAVPDAAWERGYDGEALDLGALRRVVAWRGAAGQRRLDYEDGERFVVAADGAWIARTAPPTAAAAAAAADAATRERALGAPLALALAARGVHLLHASALAGARGAIAFTADSGVGKSTFAAAAAGLRDGARRRIADDLLAVRLATAEALPHLPQPKLAPAAQYPPDAPASVPLAAVVVLERGAPGTPLVAERLAPAAAALALARATVAARWFDPVLLGEHLAACAAGAGRIAVLRLAYPSGRERLAAALDAVVAQLG